MKTNKNQAKSIKYLILGILAVFVVVSSYYVSNYILAFKHNRQIELAVNQKPDIANAKTYKNKYGQEWRMSNPGKNVLNIGGRVTTGPNIVKAEIDPLKVAVGQKQYMKVEINSDKEIAKVVAEITTDHKTVKVELKPTGSRELTYEDVTNAPFVIKDDGELVLKSDTSPSAKVAFSQMVNKLFDHAKAANTIRYSFAGDWIVHDTGETTYTTKFVAYDKDNQSNNVTLAWSDPCTLPLSKLDTSWPTQYSAQNNTAGHFKDGLRNTFVFNNLNNGTTCGTGQLTGIENVDFEINPGFTLNIPTDRLVITPGKRLILGPNARIILDDSGNTDHSVGQIVKGYIWLKDEDGDGYFSTEVLSNPDLHRFTTDPQAPSGASGNQNNGSSETSLLKDLFSDIKTKLTSYITTVHAQSTPTCSSTGSAVWRKKGEVDDNHNFLTQPWTADCDDTKDGARLGSELYCDTKTAANNYDWDCNGVDKKEYINGPYPSSPASFCTWNRTRNECGSNISGPISSGYVGTTPACGSEALFRLYYTPAPSCVSYTDEASCIGVTLAGSEYQRKQKCN